MVDVDEEVTLADVIIESMPFANELIVWCKKYPEFKDGLKVANPNSFIALLGISISYTDNVPGDEVIGFFAYDVNEKFFKQDFIINIGGNYKKFKLYSKLPSKNYGPHVQSIKGFMTKYGKNGHYANTHHYTPERLEAEFINTDLPERAKRAVALAQRLEKSGRRELTQTELIETLAKIREAKQVSIS